MPFIGNQPALSYTSFAKQDFTTSATTSYTLDNPVANANELALFINFVRQEPTTAYSASGTSLTLTSATASSDDMYCVYLGKAVQTVNPPNASVGLSQLTASGTKDATTFLRGDNSFQAVPSGGITEADNWRITSDQSISANTHTLINSSWERNDTNFDKIGTGMSESSGVFTFPNTGIYLISFQMVFERTGDSRYFTTQIHISTDSGSSFNERARSFSHIKQTSAATFQNIVISCMVDVTNASTFRLKFLTDGDATYNLKAHTDMQRTGFYCLRLGDT